MGRPAEHECAHDTHIAESHARPAPCQPPAHFAEKQQQGRQCCDHGFDLTPRKYSDKGGILCLPLDKNINGDVQAKHPDWVRICFLCFYLLYCVLLCFCLNLSGASQVLQCGV